MLPVVWERLARLPMGMCVCAVERMSVCACVRPDATDTFLGLLSPRYLFGPSGWSWEIVSAEPCLAPFSCSAYRMVDPCVLRFLSLTLPCPDLPCRAVLARALLYSVSFTR